MTRLSCAYVRLTRPSVILATLFFAIIWSCADASDAPVAAGVNPASALASDPLAQLREIRLPVPVSLWPLASGWWMLLLLAMLLLVAIVTFVMIRRRSVTAQAIRELNELEQEFKLNGQDPAMITRLSVLIRRFALRTDKHPGVAELQGVGWSEYLSAGQLGIPMALAEYIATAPYLSPESQKTLALPANESWSSLFNATRRWLRNKS